MLHLGFISFFKFLTKIQDINRPGVGVIPVILELWEAEAGESRGQEIETILANMVKPRIY